MRRVKVAGYSISLDGFAAGPDQSLELPMGVNGHDTFGWLMSTRGFMEMTGRTGGEDGPDDDFGRKAMTGFGAYIMGRNMFGPIRGEWTDDEWKGWWGENPPYHAPTFVLTHYPRASIEMEGGTVFHFVTDGIESALEKARKVARSDDIKICGGADTVRQYLSAGHVDEMHLAMAPVTLGRGKALFEGIDLRALGFKTVEHVATDKAMHVVLARS